MNESSQDELEQRAERAVRRGELLVALDALERLLAERPDDERLRGRIESVRSLLQPSELVHRRRAEPLAEQPAEAALNDAEQGELFASSGRYEQAVQCYRRAVAAHPKNELLQERLAELFRLAPPESRAVDDGLARAEPLEAITPLPPVRESISDARSSRAAEATFRPVPPSAPPAAAPPPPSLSRPPAPPASRLPAPVASHPAPAASHPAPRASSPPAPPASRPPPPPKPAPAAPPPRPAPRPRDPIRVPPRPARPHPRRPPLARGRAPRARLGRRADCGLRLCLRAGTIRPTNSAACIPPGDRS